MTRSLMRIWPALAFVMLILPVSPVHARYVPYVEQKKVIKPMDPTGLQLAGKIGMGGLLGGDQDEIYMRNDEGTRSSVDKIWLGVGLRYYVLPRLAVATEYDFAFAEHTVSGVDPVGYTMSTYNLLGVELVPLYWIINNKMFQIFIEGGGVHSRMRWASDFKDAMEDSGFELSDGSSTGFGWYAGSGFRFGVSHFVIDITTRYLYENPGVPGVSEDFDADNWVFQISPGFKF